MHSSSPHVCYIPWPVHPPCLDHSHNTWRRVEVMKLILMQFPPTSYHIIPLRSTYSPQHPQYYAKKLKYKPFHIRYEERKSGDMEWARNPKAFPCNAFLSLKI
jgi:hypothetical protein